MIENISIHVIVFDIICYIDFDAAVKFKLLCFLKKKSNMATRSSVEIFWNKNGTKTPLS